MVTPEPPKAVPTPPAPPQAAPPQPPQAEPPRTEPPTSQPPKVALEEETPTAGRRRARDTGDSRHSADLTESTRSLLSELSIRAGSGGRRRAPEPDDQQAVAELPTQPNPAAERPLADTGEPTLPWQSAGPADLGWRSGVEPATEPIGPAIPAQPPGLPAPAEPSQAETAGLGEVAQLENPGDQPKPRSEMRLADLLTEALLAYQNVRDTEPDANSATLREADSSGVQPGPSSVPEIGAINYGLGRAAGEPRHRSEERATDPRWGLSRWNLPPSNA